MDNRLLKILEQEVQKEKSKKKRKSLLNLKKEKRLMYYSGWHKDNPIKEEKTEKQTKLK